MKPFMKWQGGKTRLLPTLLAYVPEFTGSYREPFVGAGAMLFGLQPEKAQINDLNEDLINVWTVIKYFPDDLLFTLRWLQLAYNKTSDRKGMYLSYRRYFNSFFGDSTVRGAVAIFLNKSGFNGLYRVNKSGGYNVPFGDGKDKQIYSKENIMAIHHLLQTVKITSRDFSEVGANKDDFVYLDPPYIKIKKGSFTTYTAGGFGIENHYRLKQYCDYLGGVGAKFMLSNSDTEMSREIYAGYNFRAVTNLRSGGVVKGRGRVQELLITNYD